MRWGTADQFKQQDKSKEVLLCCPSAVPPLLTRGSNQDFQVRQDLWSLQQSIKCPGKPKLGTISHTEKPGLLHCKRSWSQLCLLIPESGLSGPDFPLQTGARALDSLVCKHLQLQGCHRFPLQPAFPCLVFAFQPGRRGHYSLFTNTAHRKVSQSLGAAWLRHCDQKLHCTTLHATFPATFSPLCMHWNMHGLLVIFRQVQEAQLKPMAER